VTPEFVIGLAVFVWAMFDMWSDKWPRDLGHKVFTSMGAGLFAMGAAHIVTTMLDLMLEVVKGSGK
jgi:hypothetical protein